MVPQATQTSATIRRLPAGTSRHLATKASKRASDKAAYAAKRAQQQADARTQKEVAAEAARKLLLRRQARTQYQAARRAKLRANATFDMPAVLPFLTAACIVGLCSMSPPLPAAPQPAPLHIYEPRLPATSLEAGTTATAPPPAIPRPPAPLHVYEPRLPATSPVAGTTATVTAPPPTTALAACRLQLPARRALWARPSPRPRWRPGRFRRRR